VASETFTVKGNVYHGPILTHFDDTCPTKLETNASNFAL